jgi:predicted dehydrogenase
MPAAPRTPAAKPAAKEAPVRIVVLGNSYAATCQLPALQWARSAHGDQSDVGPGAASEVVAVVGRDLEKARATAARFHIPLATTSLEEALATGPDLVLVSTPVDLHAPMVEAVLSTTDAAILCEKPFTLDPASARRLAARADGRLALIDHQLRFSPPRRRMKALIEEGAIGTPWVARSEMCFGSMQRLTRRASWWDDKRRGGGAMQAIGSHLVDGLLWMLGPAVAQTARLTTCVKERADEAGALHAVTADDHCELWLEHASGARSTVLCTTVQVHGRRSLLEVIGSHGVVRLVDEDALALGAHDGPLVPIDVHLPAVSEVAATNDSAFARLEPIFLREVVRAVAAGRTALPGAATFEEAVGVVEILAACS